MRVAEDDIQIDIKLFSFLHNEHLLTYSTQNRCEWASENFSLFPRAHHHKAADFFFFLLSGLPFNSKQSKKIFFDNPKKKSAQKEAENGKRLLNRGILKVPKTFLHIFAVRKNFSSGQPRPLSSGEDRSEIFKDIRKLNRTMNGKYQQTFNPFSRLCVHFGLEWVAALRDPWAVATRQSFGSRFLHCCVVCVCVCVALPPAKDYNLILNRVISLKAHSKHSLKVWDSRRALFFIFCFSFTAWAGFVERLLFFWATE